MKKLVLSLLLAGCFVAGHAGTETVLKRKLGKKLYTVLSEIKVAEPTEVTVIAYVSEEGIVKINTPGISDPGLKQKIENISDVRLQQYKKPGRYVYRVKLVPGN